MLEGKGQETFLVRFAFASFSAGESSAVLPVRHLQQESSDTIALPFKKDGGILKDASGCVNSR